MATTTTTGKAKKAAKVIRIDNVPGRDGKPSEYSVEIVPGERITVRATKVTGYRKTGDWTVNYVGNSRPHNGEFSTREQIRDWFWSLPAGVKNLMAGMVGRPSDAGILGDVVEESGGDRLWAADLIAFEIDEPITEPTVETYRVGDRAEFDSYNLSYLGNIVSITEKTVTIDTDRSYESKTRRLSIYDFCWRNYDGVAGKVQRNREWMD